MTLRLTTPRWKKFFPARERRCFRHFTVALPDFVRRGKCAAEIISPSNYSADGFSRVAATKHAVARASMGGEIAGMGFRAIAKSDESEIGH